MQFKSKAQARAYIRTHSQCFQRRLHIWVSRVWNGVAEEWNERYNVTVHKESPPGHSLRIPFKKLRR